MLYRWEETCKETQCTHNGPEGPASRPSRGWGFVSHTHPAHISAYLQCVSISPTSFVRLHLDFRLLLLLLCICVSFIPFVCVLLPRNILCLCDCVCVLPMHTHTHISSSNIIICYFIKLYLHYSFSFKKLFCLKNNNLFNEKKKKKANTMEWNGTHCVCRVNIVIMLTGRVN